jgi:hypothetical protein
MTERGRILKMRTRSDEPLEALEHTELRRHRLCRRDPLPGLYRSAALLVERWRAEGHEVLVISDGPPRPARLEHLQGESPCIAIDLADERRAMWEVALSLSGMRKDI